MVARRVARLSPTHVGRDARADVCVCGICRPARRPRPKDALYPPAANAHATSAGGPHTDNGGAGAARSSAQDPAYSGRTVGTTRCLDARRVLGTTETLGCATMQMNARALVEVHGCVVQEEHPPLMANVGMASRLAVHRAPAKDANVPETDRTVKCGWSSLCHIFIHPEQ